MERSNSSEDRCSSKVGGQHFNERWLLTRKTWRYMSDAGRKLFPEGVDPNNPQDVSKVEEHFQNLSRRCNEYVLHHPESLQTPPDSPHFDADLKFDFVDSMEDETLDGAVAYRRDREQSLGDISWGIQQEMFNELLQCYGAPALHEVASKLLEEQLIEEHEFSYDEEDGEIIQVDGRFMRSVGVQTDPYLDMCVQTDEDVNADDSVKVGAETRAETEAAVAHERALMKQKHKIPYDEQHEKCRDGSKPSQNNSKSSYLSEAGYRKPEFRRKPAQQHQPEDYDQSATTQELVYRHDEKTFRPANEDGLSSQQEGYYEGEPQVMGRNIQLTQNVPIHQPNQPHTSMQLPYVHPHGQHIQLQQSPPQPVIEPLQQVHQPPVLKRFWARRESLTKADPLQNQTAVQEKQFTSSVDKDRGLVAEKLASLQAGKNSAQMSPVATRSHEPHTVSQKPTHGLQNVPMGQKQKSQEKKKQENVFKLGLRCDVESHPISLKKEVDKQNIDRFKTVNYDKTLRNIKSKWVPSKEEESFIQSILSRNFKEYEREMRCKEKEVKPDNQPTEVPAKEQAKKEKVKRRKTRSIQVGDPLPQFILNSFRINSPVEVIHATKRRLRRLSSKTESISESEGSAPASGMLSPRYSITLLEERGTRDLKVSESEAYKLSQMGIPFTCKISTSDISHVEGNTPEPVRRSLSAIQVSGHIAQILHSIKGSRLFHHHGGHQSADKGRSFTKSILQSFLPTVMQRGRSSNSGQTSRLKGKKLWRNRSKSQSRASAGTTSIWTPHGTNSWMNVTGKVVTLEPTTLLQLCELERITLQSVSLSKLQAHNLGCTIKVPKEFSEVSGKKRRPMLLKKKAISGGFFDGKKEDDKGNSVCGVFGLPLSKCIENERQIGLESESIMKLTPLSYSGEEDEYSISPSRKSSRASFTSLLDNPKQIAMGSLESLNLERKRPSLGSVDLMQTPSLSPDLLVPYSQPRVPKLITTCCKHIEKYGLHSIGIFRVSSSKKRVRQLREEFDSGKDILLNNDHCPHDIATLLKEFLRDLPEPLLTKELYEALLCSQKIRHRKLQLQTLQYLIQLLPVCNRDTLHVLLNFLTVVSENSEDSTSTTGEVLQGNKMNSSNLATVFAPNILHQVKQGVQTLSATEMKTSAEERGDVINVVRCMIDHHKELFEVTAELLNESYLILMESHPDALDILLRRKCSGPDESQETIQRLLSNLLEPSKVCSSCSPSPLPIGKDLQRFDFEIETGSSVFEGSDLSSSVPLSPSDHHDFERIKSNIHCDSSTSEAKGESRDFHQKNNVRYSLHSNVGTSSQQDKFPDEIKAGGKLRSGGRESSSSKERGDEHIEKIEKPKSVDQRCFSPQEEKLNTGTIDNQPFVAKCSDKRERLRSQYSMDSQNAIKILSTNRNRVKVKNHILNETYVRRLSSPELDREGVITASLKIQVPFPQPSTLTFNQENIPYIEENISKENSTFSRRRTGSNDSFLGQPITGSMSFQPLCQRHPHKSSHDSMLSTSSMGFYTMSPSERNTPNSDMPFASGTSTPISETFSPTFSFLSPDSGTPGLSPPSTPPLPERHTCNSSSLENLNTEIKPLPPQRSKSKAFIHSLSTISRSKTFDHISANDHSKSKQAATGLKGDKSLLKYRRRRYTVEKPHSQHIPKIDRPVKGVDDHERPLWKRKDIISSEPTEPETFV